MLSKRVSLLRGVQEKDLVEPGEREKEEERRQDDVQKTFLEVSLTSDLIDQIFELFHFDGILPFEDEWTTTPTLGQKDRLFQLASF